MPAPSIRQRKRTTQRGTVRPQCRPRLENLEDRLVLFTGITLASDPLTQYATIQAAVNAANPGDTVQVGPGVYQENLVVNKSLTFLGQNHGSNPNSSNPSTQAIIEPAANDPINGNVVEIEASNVTFDGFTIEGSNPNLTGGTTINGVSINAGFGISNFDANNNFAVNNIVVQNNIVKDINLGGIAFDTFGASFRTDEQRHLHEQNLKRGRLRPELFRD